MKGQTKIMTSLTITHLRFDCVATTTLKLGRAQVGDRLRNALASVMLRTICPERERGRTPTAEHVEHCPVCWLLAAEMDPGEVRRAYTLVPPLPAPDLLEPGERFSFVLTLVGRGQHFLPYFVLAVPEMGRSGVGPGRGQFELEAIWAVNPLTGAVQPVVEPGSRVVRVPEVALGWGEVAQAAERLDASLDGDALRVRFHTPTRLVAGDALVKMPDFGVFFQRLLERIDQLGQQFAGELPRAREEVAAFQNWSNQVRLVDAQTRWLEVKGWSGRRQQENWLSGFVGTATYRTGEWEPLLPWLVLGQAVQVGKFTVKGNGLFEIVPRGGEAGYWQRGMAAR